MVLWAGSAEKKRLNAMIKIDTWYDIRCDECNLYRSNDIGGYGMDMDKKALRIYAKHEGWKCRDGKTLCPECSKKRTQIDEAIPRARRTQLRVEAWFDLRCDNCCLARSTDFGLGMERKKGVLQHDAYVEGWGNRDGKTLCPKCVLEARRER